MGLFSRKPKHKRPHHRRKPNVLKEMRRGRNTAHRLGGIGKALLGKKTRIRFP